MTLKALLGGVAVASLLLVSTTVAKAKDIVETAIEAGTFNTLVKAVKAAELVDALKAEGPFTVFAATDEAFAELPAGTNDELLKPENREKLRAVLTFHVVPGKVMSKDAAGKQAELDTLQGQKVTVDGTGSAVTVNGATVVTPDVAASNGVIHVIDAVILPAS